MVNCGKLYNPKDKARSAEGDFLTFFLIVTI